jgi:hypothetical protein
MYHAILFLPFPINLFFQILQSKKALKGLLKDFIFFVKKTTRVQEKKNLV